MSRRRQDVAVSEGFGTRLAKVLADQRITQQALAEKLNASPSFVSSLVRGLKAPGAEFIVALHGALGVNLNWLLLGKGRIYGDEVDSDLLQGTLLQVQLARLATLEQRPEAVALLRNALPALDLPAPMPSPARERLDAFLGSLVAANQDLPLAITLVNNALMQAPATDRPRAIGVAIEELVRSRLSPSILNLLKPAPVEVGNVSRRDPGDNINWDNEPLPAGRKVGDRLGRQRPVPPPKATKSSVKPKKRLPKK